MKELKLSGKQLSAVVDPIGAVAPRLRLKKEVIVMLMLIRDITGKSSSTSAHCF